MSKKPTDTRTFVVVQRRHKSYRLYCEDIQRLWKRKPIKTPPLPSYGSSQRLEEQLNSLELNKGLSETLELS